MTLLEGTVTHTDLLAQRRPGTATGPAVAPVEILVDALGVAWTTFTLYEQPERVEAFQRAVAILSHCPSYPWRVEATPEGFVFEGEPVPHRREATLRVAHRIFALGTAAIELGAPPSAEDLLKLFHLLASHDPPADSGTALQRQGVRTIALLHRELIAAGEERQAEAEEAPWYLAYDGDPEPFVHRLVEGREDRPSAVGREFVAEYERVCGLADPADTWGREEVVHAFTDAFWFLPRRHRAAVLTCMLERQASPENTAFLDQFGSLELAELNRMFGAAGHPLLAEYARVAAEQGGRERADVAGLLDPTHSPADSLGKAVIHHIAHVLEAMDPSGTPAVSAALERLRQRRPQAGDDTRSSLNAMRALIDLGVEAGDVTGAADLWAAKVTDALREGNLGWADRWLGAVSGLGLQAGHRQALLRALADALDEQSVQRLVVVLGSEARPGPGEMVRRVAPLFAADRLVAELGAEKQMARRRILIKALTLIAAANPAALYPHLEDPRWYVVRNIILILGASGRPEAASRVEAGLAHGDHRVRLETLVALRRLAGEKAAARILGAIDDPHEAVAAKAAALVGKLTDAGIDERLISRLERTGEREERLRLIGVLGHRTTDAARRVLEREAAGWFPFWGTARAVRRAARAALGGSS